VHGRSLNTGTTCSSHGNLKVENRQVAQGLSALSFWDGTELVGGATVIESNVDQPKQSIISRGNSSFEPASETRFLSDGGETLSDADPDPIQAGQQYAGGRPTRRGGGPPEGPAGRLLSDVYEAKVRTLAKLEPNNPYVTQFRDPNWRPRQSHIDRLEEELIKARQRAPGAIDTQASGIGIGPFARESLPARSESRYFNEEERIDGNRLGSLYGCPTCGTRMPGTASGNWVLDHQQATRLNPLGEGQRLFPQCLSCSARQGGLISSKVGRQ
jgi:hypothetical protein